MILAARVRRMDELCQSVRNAPGLLVSGHFRVDLTEGWRQHDSAGPGRRAHLITAPILAQLGTHDRVTPPDM
jgi:hypothetical protein